MGNPSRSFTLTLDARLNEQVIDYMHSQGLAAKPDAVRELILTALASVPSEGQVAAAKNRAYYECKRWAMTRLSLFLAELATELRQSAAELPHA